MAEGCLEFVSGIGNRSCDGFWIGLLAYATGQPSGGTASIPYHTRRPTQATIPSACPTR